MLVLLNLSSFETITHYNPGGGVDPRFLGRRCSSENLNGAPKRYHSWRDSGQFQTLRGTNLGVTQVGSLPPPSHFLLLPSHLQGAETPLALPGWIRYLVVTFSDVVKSRF